MPDIDTDFADTGRDKVVDYCRKKYGNDRVAQICTF
jgi:DNA polymerase-3 subunit alpha